MHTTKPLLATLIAGFAAAFTGCGPSESPSQDNLGTITMDLTLAPTDARCAVITATPATGAAVTRQIPLEPEQTAVFSLTGLPTGNVTLTEQVFTTACAMIGGQTPTWTSDPVSVTLQAGVTVSVSFNLHLTAAGGQVNVTSNFPNPSQPSFQEFAAPAGVHSDPITDGPDGNLWFAADNQIGQITVTGTIAMFPIPTTTASVFGVAAGGDGNVWFTESGPGKIGRITPAGAITEFPLPAPAAILSITPGPDGALWFAEEVPSKIGRITTSGAITEFPVTANAGPISITTGPDRNLWFTELVGKVGRMTTTGALTEFPVSVGTSLQDIAAGSDGNLWFTEGLANKIGRMTTGGAFVEFPIPTPNSGLSGIAVGADGNMWFTEVNGNQVGRITPAGVITEFPIPTQGAVPLGITLGPNGAIWFTEAMKIGELQP